MHLQSRYEQRFYIKKLEPVSLLNAVYKKGSSCIANRIKTVLPLLINEDQIGFISNRYIGDNISLNYDVINYLNSKNLHSMLLCFDFRKAFDSLLLLLFFFFFFFFFLSLSLFLRC